MYRKTYAEIDLNAITHNYKHYSNTVPNKTIIPTVKADAYGHGVIKVVKKLYSEGVRYFAVSLLEEALEIREVFNDVEILIMGSVDEDGFKVCSENNLTFTLHDEPQFFKLIQLDYPVKFHVKFDSGMHRLGFTSPFKIVKIIEALKVYEHLHFEGIYTHFATSDESDETFFYKQLSRFKKLLDSLPEKPKIVHASNSSAILKYEQDMAFTTHARLGISLYGLSLDENKDHLKSAFKLITNIVQLKHLNPGDRLGYGLTYEAKEASIIAVLPVGYGDGFIRSNQNGYVSINQKRYQIVGRICMDHLFVKVDNTITLNDKVVIMGDNVVSIDDVANHNNTINYEVVTILSKRVPRIYR